MEEIKETKNHNSAWKKLISEYKKLLKEHKDVAFDNEAYKWKTITECKNLAGKELLSFLTKDNSNLFDHLAIGEAKNLSSNDGFDSIYENLIDEKIELNERLKNFKNSIQEIYSESDKKRIIKDERSASVFLTCHNYEKYTFYKDSYYKLLCNYLEIKTELAGEKYSHYLNLIKDFENYVTFDSEIINFYDLHTAQYEKSSKLIAQNIIYTLFESGAKFVNLYGDSKMSTTSNPLAEKLADLLLHTHNLILHGAPGTGKTYLAQQIAKELGCSKDEVDFVQFHPSYDYTDFVEGLRPVKNDDGNSIGFERKDGVFKEFCKRALKNLTDSKKSVEDFQKEISTDEQIENFLEKAIDDETEFEIAHGNKFKIEDLSDKNILISISANKITNELSLPKNDLVQLLNSDTKIENGADIKSFFNRKWRTQQDSYIFTLYNEIKSQKQSIEVKLTDDFIQKLRNDEKHFNTSKYAGVKKAHWDFSVTKFDKDNDEFDITANGDKRKDNHELIISQFEEIVALSKTVNSYDEFKNKFPNIPDDKHQTLFYYCLYQEFQNCKNVKKVEKKNFLFIIDEINRGELSKIFGELFYAIEPGYRGEKGRIQTQYQNLVEDDDVFMKGFYVPENVYIIGTMNDIDRSVDTMDFAFRRRFTFYEVKAEDTIEMLDEKTDENGNITGLPPKITNVAKTRITNLNNAISKIAGLNSSYYIGGAYFLKLNELDGDFEQLWKYHLEGLLREYLRGHDDAETKLSELKEAYDSKDFLIKPENDINSTSYDLESAENDQ